MTGGKTSRALPNHRLGGWARCHVAHDQGTSSELVVSQMQQRGQSFLVKADHDLTIDERDGRRRHGKPHQVLHGLGIVRHVPSLKLNPVPGEELLDPFAEHSTRLVEDDDRFRHGETPRYADLTSSTSHSISP